MCCLKASVVPIKLTTQKGPIPTTTKAPFNRNTARTLHSTTRAVRPTQTVGTLLSHLSRPLRNQHTPLLVTNKQHQPGESLARDSGQGTYQCCGYVLCDAAIFCRLTHRFHSCAYSQQTSLTKACLQVPPKIAEKYVNLLVVGESGLGKTTFIRNCFSDLLHEDFELSDASWGSMTEFKDSPSVFCTHLPAIEVPEALIRLRYSVQDVPGYVLLLCMLCMLLAYRSMGSYSGMPFISGHHCAVHILLHLPAAGIPCFACFLCLDCSHCTVQVFASASSSP